jgi:hypothetical protein
MESRTPQLAAAIKNHCWWCDAKLKPNEKGRYRINVREQVYGGKDIRFKCHLCFLTPDREY